jgi:hypothetical protein
VVNFDRRQRWLHRGFTVSVNGSVYYLPRPISAADLAIMQRLDRLHLEFPFAGSRMLRGLLASEGCKIGRRHVKALMRRMGLAFRLRPEFCCGLDCNR